MSTPKTIKLPSELPAGLLIPGHVFRQGGFKFEPRTYIPENERLKEIPVTAKSQIASLASFIENPQLPVYYGVGGTPDDNKAKYFAAYLSYIHARSVKNAVVHWHSIYGGFHNPLLDDMQAKSSITMLVLHNLATCATNVKLDKLRDILDAYSNIPRIVVSAGIDPMSFATTKVNYPINSIANFTEKVVRQRVEVV